MDGVVYMKQKPPKDWDEAFQQTQTTLVKGWNENFGVATKVISEKSSSIKESVQSGQAFNNVKESTMNLGTTISNKSSELKSSIASSE